MHVRECFVCDGLFNVRDLNYVGKNANCSHVLQYICAECLKIQWAMAEKKFPFSLTMSTSLGINNGK